MAVSKIEIIIDKKMHQNFQSRGISLSEAEVTAASPDADMLSALSVEFASLWTISTI